MVAKRPNTDMALRFEVLPWSSGTTAVLPRLHTACKIRTRSVMEHSSLELCRLECQRLLGATSLLYEDHLRNLLAKDRRQRCVAPDRPLSSGSRR